MTPTHWRILAELDAGTLEWGAAVNACWSALIMNGYVERHSGRITQKGKDALKERGGRVMFDVSWEAQIERIRKEYEDEMTALRARIAELEAEVERLTAERDAILADSTINSDQRDKYKALCARILVGKASQQDAVDAIQQLCRDNERLAIRCSDVRSKPVACAAAKGDTP